MTVFANVFLGMQLALSSYLQVCFSIANDVVMSISLMFERPEAGTQHFFAPLFPQHSHFAPSDLMLRKPRNARTDRLTDWRFFVQIYLVCTISSSAFKRRADWRCSSWD
jgi:sodium/potassium-transporting ATPase subunit alpha